MQANFYTNNTNTPLLKYLLLFQGLYYGLTGLWALFALDNFMEVTRHQSDPFDMISIAALAVVLGAVFLAASRAPGEHPLIVWLLFGSAVAIAIPEAMFLEEIKSSLFFYDLFEEIIVGLLALPFLPKTLEKLKNF